MEHGRATERHPASWRWASLILVLLFPVKAGARESITTDVIVYGGSAGGVIAAVQAARMGKRVALVEPGLHLGGASVEGLGGSDIDNHGGFQNSPAVGGLAREFYRRVSVRYGRAAQFDRMLASGAKDPALWRFESKVAEAVFDELVAAAGVQVFRGQRLAEVTRDAASRRVLTLRTEGGSTFEGRVFVDASIEGDLLAGAGVTTVIGRESNATYGETKNGIRGVNTYRQFEVAVDPYRTPGVPASGLIPTIQDEPLGTPGAGDARIQAYCFRLCLTKNAANRAPFTRPAGYDPAQYEIYRRYAAAGGRLWQPSAQLPNGKTDLGSWHDLSGNLYGMNHAYPAGTPEVRARIYREHLAFTQGLMWFMANDPALPAALRSEWAQWGLCRDEFTDNGGWPRQLYVRDARRMVSDHVITEAHTRKVRQATVTDPVAVAFWPPDTHHVRRIVRDGKAYNEGFVFGGDDWAPFGLSYRALVPRAAEATNLLTPTCLSSSHVAHGAYRLEWTYMALGQAAGTAAALAIDDGVDVQAVSYGRLAARLRADGQVLGIGAAAAEPVRPDAGAAPEAGPVLVVDAPMAAAPPPEISASDAGGEVADVRVPAATVAEAAADAAAPAPRVRPPAAPVREDERTEVQMSGGCHVSGRPTAAGWGLLLLLAVPLRRRAWALLALLAGCTGEIGSARAPAPIPGDAPGDPPRGAPRDEPPRTPMPMAMPLSPMPPVDAPACADPAKRVAPAPVRRLTRREYDNVVAALLGDTSAPSKAFIADGEPRGFQNNADAPMTALSAAQYAEAAERLARTAVTSRLTALVPCAATAPDDGCARQFIASFGKRAYRRPLSPAEQERLFALYQRARTTLALGFPDGVRLVLQTMLQSPHFLNHIERGVPGGAGPTPLSPYEIASRLSFFLWASMPDDALFAAADAGKLATGPEIDVQVDRMLRDPRARAGVWLFFRQWLDLDKIDATDKETAAFPLWSAKVKSALRPETEAFVNDVVWNGDGTVATLLTSPTAFVNTSLAPIYGVPDPGMGDTLVKAALDPTRRAGVLTLVTSLAVHAHSDQTSPTHRGLFVRERLMCQTMPSPPPDVEVTAPKVDPRLTTRERFARHADEPYCAGCHRLIDPIGLGFEHYDAIGRWRDTEAGKPIDATGEVVNSQGGDGHFTGAVELAGRLARSEAVRDCFAGQWLDYAIAVPAQELPCAVRAVVDGVDGGRLDVKGLIRAITRSEAFRFRAPITPEVCR